MDECFGVRRGGCATVCATIVQWSSSKHSDTNLIQPKFAQHNRLLERANPEFVGQIAQKWLQTQSRGIQAGPKTPFGATLGMET